MKNIDFIIAHLTSRPEFSKLRKHKCFELIKKSLPPTLQKGVLFIYVKNKTLFFALKHPAYKMEFDYKLSSIKNLLRVIEPVQESCKELNIKDIKTFVSRYNSFTNLKRRADSTPYYKERASGNFKVLCKDKKLKDKFESLKDLIKCFKH